MSKITFAEAVETVLADTRRTMTAEEIWSEIERRGLIVSDGKTPAATLYTELMRKSVNWRAKDDDRLPRFYRRGGGAFGRWIDLTPEQQKAMLAGAATPSPSDSWRELLDRVKDDPSWKTRIAALTVERARVASEIGDRIRAYLSGASTLEVLRAALDQRSRGDWATFTFNGTSFAMLLNMLTKVTAAAPSLDATLRATMRVPPDEAAGRATLQGMSAALETLRLSGDKRKIPHPNRIPKLFSGLWHVQAPAEWPIYYRSARDALAQTGVVTPSDDPIESYLTFRRFFLQLAGELGVTTLELEQLCVLQQEAEESNDGDDDDATPPPIDEEVDDDHEPPLPAALPYTIDDALARVFVSRDELTRMLALLRYKRNLVLQGPPGVGKTFVAAELAYVMLGAIDEARIKRVQFHQSYAYEDFVRGYRPKQAGGFEYRDGPMLEFCERARSDARPHVMIIDEINRGNLSKILGELMLLIEPDKREERWALHLAYAKPGERPFWVPPNLYVIGTMNTADRSLALVDYALRRRFAFAWLLPAFGPSLRAFLGGRKGVERGLRSHHSQRRRAPARIASAVRVRESFAATSTTRA